MPSAIVNATIQSALLSGLSNVLAQAITLYRGQKPLHLNIVAVIQFVTFTLINCPPNYLWQEYLEDRYPGFTTTNSQMARSPEKPNPAGAKSLNVRNTITKFVLDMTLGAAVNTVLFIAVIGALKGLDGNDILEAIQRDFWPITVSGLKLWPLVSLLNFTVVPVEKRMVVGSLFGVLWGIYLSLLATS